MNKINLYLCKLSIKYILFNLLIITILVLFINSIEISRIIEGKNLDLKNFLYLSILKIPSIIIETFVFIIIIALAFLFRNLVTNNEFISLRNSGLSILDIYKPIAFIIFIFGLIILIFINPLAAKLEKNFLNSTSKQNDNIYSIKFIDDGMWMKNITAENNKNYIIVDNIDLDKMIATDIKILVTGSNNDKLILSEEGKITNNNFYFNNVIILDIKKQKYSNYENYKIKLNFTKNNIKDALSNYKLVPFYKYWDHIKNLKKFNLYSQEISLHYISEILKPFFMVIIGLVVLGISGKFKRNESFFKILFFSILIGFITVLIEEILITITMKINLSYIFSYFIIFTLPLLIGIYTTIRIEND